MRSFAPIDAHQNSLPLAEGHRVVGPREMNARRILKELRAEIANGNEAIRRMHENVEHDRRRLKQRNETRRGGAPAEQQAPAPARGRTADRRRVHRLPGLEAA